MQFLVVFACALAAASAGHIAAPYGVYAAQHLPVIGPNGVPVDTPAVQHATAAHLAHKVEAHARNGDYAVAPIVASTYAHGAPLVASSIAHHGVVAHAPIVAHQPAAWPTTAGWPSNVNGVPLETPEVVAAKTNHFAAHAEAHVRNGDYAIAAPVVASTYAHATPVVASTYAYGSPVVASTYAHAAPIVPGTNAHIAVSGAAWPTTVNGVPLETPEVVAAKAKHFAAHAEALTRHTRGVYTPSVYGAYTYGAYPSANYAHYY